ncbi:putative Carbohydrate-binding family 6 protein [Paratrimastix pyriformis]|uniref:Carbohydrate-binding family 6 protein n=1 Tax=Paratrimastix pyriformis TaxID=342808 RepID=A0ABQ8UME9_9EUKA|nr:putative Carbohydrate-binding family 6 protein [Paratrimastix pyriformis]
MRRVCALLFFLLPLLVSAESKYGLPSMFLSNWKDMTMTWATNRNFNKQNPIRPNGPTGLRISANWAVSALSQDTFAIDWNGAMYGSNSNYWDGVSLLIPQTGEWKTTFTTDGSRSLPFQLVRSYYMPPNEPFYIVDYAITAPQSATGISTVRLLDLVVSDHPASSQLLYGWRCTPSQYGGAPTDGLNEADRDLYMVDARKTGGFYFSMGAFQPVSRHQVGGVKISANVWLRSMLPFHSLHSPHSPRHPTRITTGAQASGLPGRPGGTATINPGQTVHLSFFRTVQVDWRPAVDASLRARGATAQSWISQTATSYAHFLAQGKRPKGLDADTQLMFDASVMLLKNSQNPTVGTIVASFHPSYGYKTWTRDGLFAALILSEAGYDAEATAYVRWMATAELRAATGEGFHTCYDYWTGAPVGFVEPQYGRSRIRITTPSRATAAPTPMSRPLRLTGPSARLVHFRVTWRAWNPADSSGAFLMGVYHTLVQGQSADAFKARTRQIEDFFLNNGGYQGLAAPDYSIWEVRPWVPCLPRPIRICAPGTGDSGETPALVDACVCLVASLGASRPPGHVARLITHTPTLSSSQESSDPHSGQGLPLSHFSFTQAMAFGGLIAAGKLEDAWGNANRAAACRQRAADIQKAANGLLWITTPAGGYFARGLWNDTGRLDDRADSSSLATIYLGLTTGDRARWHYEHMVANLTQNGGGALSRYWNDPFFFDSIYNPAGIAEVGAAGAPWGVTSMFGAWVELMMGKVDPTHIHAWSHQPFLRHQGQAVTARLQWMVKHAAAGMLPVGEAVDGVSGEFVWSSAPDLYESGGVFVWTVLMQQGLARMPNPAEWK